MRYLRETSQIPISRKLAIDMDDFACPFSPVPLPSPVPSPFLG